MLLFGIGMNPFNQMPRGQRSTPPLPLGSALNQVSKVMDPAACTSHLQITDRFQD